jgi:hypothetical protein
MKTDVREMSNTAWIVYWVLMTVGVVLGLLCGVGSFSGFGLGIFVVVTVTVFVTWVVLTTDPRLLAEHPTYKGESKVRRKGRW